MKRNSNRLKEILLFLAQWEADRNGLTVTYPEIYQAIRMRPTHFNRFMHRANIQPALKALGWKIVKGCPCFLVKQ